MTLFAAALGAELPTLSAQSWPGVTWETASPESLGIRPDVLQQAQDFATSTGDSTGGSGYVIKGGKLIWSWGDPAATHDIKSTTKSFGSTALGLAIGAGLVQLDDAVQPYLPDLGTPPTENAIDHADWLSQITFRDLAAHTAGFSKDGGYEPLHFQPGAKWSYSDGAFNWLADALTVTYQDDLLNVMTTEVFDKIGIQSGQLTWRDNYYRSDEIEDPFNPGTYYERREFGSGISASVDALARMGYLWLHGGQCNGEQILPSDYIAAAIAPQAGSPEQLPVDDTQDDAELYGSAPTHNGLGWWNNADNVMAEVPADAFWAWGLHDNLIIVVPSLDMVITRTGNLSENWDSTGQEDYISVIEPFFNLLLDDAIAQLGDANCDGAVDISDLQILGDNWQTENATWLMGDFSGDGVVNLTDLQILGDNWDNPQQELEGLLTFVPEPSTSLGLSAILAAPASRRWRRTNM